ncbi:penicillin-binding transpeptidase domain-containing protein, partial [Clostridium tepidum]
MKDVHYANAISGQIPTEKLAGAYGSFANGGTYYKPYYVESVDFPDGTSQKMEPEGKKAMNDST